MMAMIADQQFETADRPISNLDRCNLCGRPRAVHGIDWTCSPGRTASTARVIAGTVLGGLLALAGILTITVTSDTAGSAGTLGAASMLIGMTLVICAAIIGGRQHS